MAGQAAPGQATEPTALWVVPVADLGGVARHVLDVARHGLPGYRLVVACPAGPLSQRLSEAGTAVVTTTISPADGVVAGVRALRRVIATVQPRVVHSHLSHADLVAALATIGSPCDLVTTEHGIARDDLIYHGSLRRSRIRALAHTVRLRRADAVIGVSQATLDVVREKWHPGPRTRQVVLLNGVDRPPPATPRTPGLRIVSLARLAPEKGLDDLLAAFALVQAAHPEAHLTIAGSGPLDQSLRTRAAALGLQNSVTFPGHVDPGPLLADGDVVAQLSVWENTSYTLLDAVVHGLGVAATPVGGNPEIVGAACLVERQDHAAVAETMLSQGLNLSRRPHLPASWPTIGDMCAGISDVYSELEPRSTSR